MLRIEMLPAAHGDCLFVEYGPPDSPNRILIDGGPHYTYGALRSRILMLAPDQRHFELLVITHIDGDHIDGIIKLVQDDQLGVTFGDIWFNGYKHIEQYDLGAKGGEFLGALIEDRDLAWNEAFGGDTVVVAPEPAELATKPLPGGARLTLVGPGPEQLTKLRKEWVGALKSAGFGEPGDRANALAKLAERRDMAPPQLPLGDKDDSAANGSSIAFLLETPEGQSALLVGDAYAEVLEPNLRRLMTERGSSAQRLKVDCFKLPHHGSIKNMDPYLANLVDAKHILVSTSGAIYGHPDEDTLRMLIARRGQYKPRLVFNYRSEFNAMFDDAADQQDKGYEVVFPTGVCVEMS